MELSIVLLKYAMPSLKYTLSTSQKLETVSKQFYALPLPICKILIATKAAAVCLYIVLINTLLFPTESFFCHDFETMHVYTTKSQQTLPQETFQSLISS